MLPSGPLMAKKLSMAISFTVLENAFYASIDYRLECFQAIITVPQSAALIPRSILKLTLRAISPS